MVVLQLQLQSSMARSDRTRAEDQTSPALRRAVHDEQLQRSKVEHTWGGAALQVKLEVV